MADLDSPLVGFVIHVTHEDDRSRVNPIVQEHLHNLMQALCDADIVDPAIDCGPYFASSAGSLREES